ncbi:MAG: hypothetical protein RJA61_325 [Candidatus Parcubacteria bacterium]|jgi:trigger factor
MKYQNIKIKKLPKSEAEITGEIPVEVLEKAKAKALRNLAKEAEMPGFRKGNVPEKIVAEKLGTLKILQEAAYDSLEDAWPEVIKESKLSMFGDPHITITKIAEGSPVEFKIKVYVTPEVTLPDYKKIAKEGMKGGEKIEVTEKDIEDVILEIRKHKAHEKLHETNEAHDHEKFVEEVKEGELPELNDEFVKSVGDFKDVTDFKNKIKENVLKEKEWKVKDKKRGLMTETLIKESKIEIPLILVEAELDRMTAQFKGDVERAGTTYEKYLEHIKKTDGDIRKEWFESAEKRAKLQLIIARIAEAEKIEPEKDQVQKEVDNILKMHKGTEPLRAEAYVRMVLTNEKVMLWLEGQK